MLLNTLLIIGGVALIIRSGRAGPTNAERVVTIELATGRGRAEIPNSLE